MPTEEASGNMLAPWASRRRVPRQRVWVANQINMLWWLKESIMNTKHIKENHSEIVSSYYQGVSMRNCLDWPIGMLVRNFLTYSKWGEKTLPEGHHFMGWTLDGAKVGWSWAQHTCILSLCSCQGESKRVLFHSASAKGMDVVSPALSCSCYCDFFTVVEPKYTRPSLSCSRQDALFQQKGKLGHYLTSARRALIQRKKDIGLAREWKKENPFVF